LKPVPFEYARPATIDEAVALLDDDSIVIAGGQTLVPMLAMRMARPDRVVDINHIPGLAGITDKGSEIVIGAATRQVDVLNSTLVAEKLPLLSRAISFVGHTQTRNRGTVGGSLAHADPAAEIPLASLAMDAEVTLKGAGGKRRISVDEFLVGPMMTAREPDELIVSLHYALAPVGTRAGTGFHEVSERHGDFAMVAAAARIELDSGGACRTVALALGGVDARAMRIPALEAMLAGQKVDAALLSRAVAEIPGAIDPGDDQHATAAYRRRVAVALGERALADALRNAEGGAA
jgi:CO/xanthine dehydrogenase FAD-binding subunit